MKYFIECTHTYHTRMNSGIQRVVRNIVRSAAASDIAGEIVPVVFENNAFFAIDKEIPYPTPHIAPAPLPRGIVATTKRFLNGLFQGMRKVLATLVPYRPFVVFLYAPRTQWGLSRVLLLPFGRAPALSAPPVPEPIRVEKGDVLVLLDSSWHLDIWKAVDGCRDNGAQVAVVIYDLIPYAYPQFCVSGLVQSFSYWVKQAATRIDAVVAISETIAQDFKQALPKIVGLKQPAPAISYFWLGSELDGEQATEMALPADVVQVCSDTTPTYVYVSTIEPRKNHRYALQAFEILWQRGVKANFVIVGRVGWKCDEFIDDVHHHAQYGKQLFMFNHADDNALAHIYDSANGLIFTSITEGFGLPIVEGLQRGLPVFASDIPVFREIGKNGVQFVDLGDPASLADAVAAHVDAGAPRLQEPISWLSWQDSTKMLFARIDECLAARKTVVEKEVA